MFPPPALVALVLSTLLAEHVTGQFRLLLLVVPCYIVAPWLPAVLSMLEDIPHSCRIVKNLIMDDFYAGTQVSAVTAVNPLAAQRCVLYRQGFSPSV